MKSWKFWLGFAISALFLWIALRGLGLEDVGAAVADANLWWLLPGIAVYFVGVWARAWRWHFLLGPIKPIPTRTMFPVVAIGYMGNNIYPARAGEVLRAVVLKRREGVPISASLATIIVERIFDGVVMLAFVFLNLPRLAELTGDSGFLGNIRQAAVWGTAVFALALLVFLLAAMFPGPAAQIVEWLVSRWTPERFRDRLLEIMGRFLDGLASLRSPVNALMVFLTSVVIWLLETGKYWFVMHAFPFEVDFFTLMLMNGIVNLATTIPSAPGYVGTFDAPGIAVLAAAGVDRAVAAGYTLVLHAALWLPITALGAYYALREGVRWEDGVRRLEADPAEAVERGHGGDHDHSAYMEAAPAAMAEPPANLPPEIPPPAPDDLKKLEGIGPKVEAVLKAAGIETFAQLAAAEVDRLEAILDEADFQYMDPGSWPEQARLAADGDWDALQKLMDKLTGGLAE